MSKSIIASLKRLIEETSVHLTDDRENQWYVIEVSDLENLIEDQPAPVERVTESQFQKDIEDLEGSVIEANIPTGPIWQFIVKYRDHVSGRFVPEEEIQKLINERNKCANWDPRDATYLDLDRAVSDFLKAIARKEGQDA